MTAPHRELELKAVVADAEAFRRRLGAAGAERRFTGRMRDLRYDRGVELVSRDEVLRVRTLEAPDGGVETVLAWKGPTMRSADGYKLREEIELPVAGAGDPGRLLEALGYRPVHVIEREIEIYRLGAATVRLERYPRMDVLVEVEGEPAAIERAIEATGISRGEFTAEPLAEFARRFEERSGERAVLARTGPVSPGAEPR